VLYAAGEFTQFFGGVAGATDEMLAAVDRLSEVLERDVALRLEVVELLAFDDPNTDPYFGFFADLLDRNTVVADSLVGTANYDAGQVLTLIAGRTSFSPWGTSSGISPPAARTRRTVPATGAGYPTSGAAA
jgi:hypothetical protein